VRWGLNPRSCRMLEEARARGDRIVLEPEGLLLAAELGIGVPVHRLVPGWKAARSLDLDPFPGDRVVVKVISPDILHRSDVGGVRVVPRDHGAVADAVEAMERSLAGTPVSGYLVAAFVPHSQSLGGELLLGARWTDDFGPVVTLGAGGVYAEHLAAHLRPGHDIAIVSPGLTPVERLDELLSQPAAMPAATGQLRGQTPRITQEALTALVRRVMEFAASAMPHLLTEFEVNPLVPTPDGPVALDVLIRLGDAGAQAAPRRPLQKVAHLLRPASMGIIGVSEKLNPGHLIVRNVRQAGFDPDRLHIVKPGADRIEGCRCYPDIASLPERVDLFVISVEASLVPGVLEDLLRHRKAESIILIPGGLGERAEGRPIEQAVRSALESSRSTPWHGPVLNGGNCLGVRSLPGRYDTMFIHEHKLPHADAPETPLAIISQSGAFSLARTSSLPMLNPRYLISLGNQTDLTVSDYLFALSEDPDVSVFACYVEGFTRLDGRRFLEAAARIQASGRTVILYRAGRTASGARASASHTASIAGDYAVTRALARAAGVVVAETIQGFTDLTRLFCLLRDRDVGGWRLGAMSNAGFECVAVGDTQGAFRLEAFTGTTCRRLQEVLERCRLQRIVDVHNPLDLTPILDDAGYEDAIRAVMEDAHVDVGMVGVVPLTGALNTLPPGGSHPENVHDASSVAARMVRLRRSLEKPWVAVVDAGRPYDPMVEMLERGGVPVFRDADRALRLLEIFCRQRLAMSAARLVAA
jgi:acyl-CoA synthetase (NDP forming)